MNNINSVSKFQPFCPVYMYEGMNLFSFPKKETIKTLNDFKSSEVSILSYEQNSFLWYSNKFKRA